MKFNFKAIALVVLMAITVQVLHAQVNAGVSGNLTNVAKRSLDTVTNTGTKSLTGHVPGSWKQVTVTLANANLTGTQSGVSRLFASLDGVNYFRVRSYQLHNSQVDSLVITTSTLTKNFAWVIDGSPFPWLQTQTTGIGTVTFTVAGKFLAH